MAIILYHPAWNASDTASRGSAFCRSRYTSEEAELPCTLKTQNSIPPEPVSISHRPSLHIRHPGMTNSAGFMRDEKLWAREAQAQCQVIASQSKKHGVGVCPLGIDGRIFGDRDRDLGWYCGTLMFACGIPTSCDTPGRSGKSAVSIWIWVSRMCVLCGRHARFPISSCECGGNV